MERPMAMNQMPGMMMHQMPDGSMMGSPTDAPKPMSMGDMMADMNAGLIGKTGAEFDQAFLSEMIIHHQGAVDMARLVITNSNRSDLKDFAADIISAQSKEIDQIWSGLKHGLLFAITYAGLASE